MRVRELSVFFPAFDEEANIERTVTDALAVLRDLPLDRFEVVVVDDGSRDSTARVVDVLEATHTEVRAVHHAENLGYGAALRTGFASTRCPWVFFSDGDGQFDLHELERFLAVAETADVVVGDRVRRADHLGRRLNTWMWGGVVRLCFRIPVHDVDCAFKLISRDVLDRIGPLTSTGAMISTELLARIHAAGIPIVQLGVRHYPRRGGTPTGASPRVILRAFRELARLRWQMWRSPRPLRSSPDG